MKKVKTGVLLINLGTPASPGVFSVGRYLREFLMDGKVVDLPYFLRWMLVHFVIVPFRSFRSSRAYRSIWTDRGSPLLIHSENLAQKVASHLLTHGPVELAMRYGQPSLRKGLKSLLNKGVERIIVVPLYPQYAESTTGTCLDKVKAELRHLKFSGAVRWCPPFFDQDFFIRAIGEPIQKYLNTVGGENAHLVFSFHGLPESHLKKESENCLTQGCCESFQIKYPNCYRAQCFKTARLVASFLKLEESRFSVSFQSRLGRKPWLRPYTQDRLAQLPQENKLSLVISTPSFVADCLETLEEIAKEGRQIYLDHGGRGFRVISCPNVNEDWAKSLSSYILKSSISLVDG